MEAAPIPFQAITVAPAPSLQELADQAADRWGVSSSTLRQLVHEESRWNPEAVGDGGCSIGLVQINLCAHKHITKEQALDPVFALDFAAQHISEGFEHMWTPCSCWGLVSTKIKGLPRMADIQPNSEPTVGGVAIFEYSNNVKHVAYITKIEDSGMWVFESNYRPCAIGSRFISYTDPHLVGFFFPG